jgi:hypothetical protein
MSIDQWALWSIDFSSVVQLDRCMGSAVHSISFTGAAGQMYGHCGPSVSAVQLDRCMGLCGPLVFSGAARQMYGALCPIGFQWCRMQAAAASVAREATLLRSAGAAADHPLLPSYPEGEYLSNVLLRLG